MITIKEKFIPTEFGWVSPKTPPSNHNNVVVLIWFNGLYFEKMGFFEDEDWIVYDLDNDMRESAYEIQGWFPIPYTPHNH